MSVKDGVFKGLLHREGGRAGLIRISDMPVK